MTSLRAARRLNADDGKTPDTHSVYRQRGMTRSFLLRAATLLFCTFVVVYGALAVREWHILHRSLPTLVHDRLVETEFMAAQCPVHRQVECFQTIDAQVRAIDLEILDGPTLPAFLAMTYFRWPAEYRLRATSTTAERLRVRVGQQSMGPTDAPWSMFVIQDIVREAK